MTARAMSSGVSASISRRGVEERRVGHAGLDQRDADAGVVEVLARRLAHAGDGPLGGRVERALERAAARDRAGEQQVALGLLERVHRRADGERRAVDVGEDHRLPVLDVALVEAARAAEAGVGEGDVDAPVGVERALHQRLLVGPLGDVAGDREGALVAAELLGEGGELVLGAGAEDEPVAGLGGMAGGRGADAGGGAGDEEDGIGLGMRLRLPRFAP